MNPHTFVEGPGGWRGAALYADPASMSLCLRIVRPHIAGVAVLTGIGPKGPTIEAVPDQPCAEPDVPPLRIPDDLARTLYEILRRWYGDSPRPAGDPAQAREDLLHERQRVDKLLDFLTGPPGDGS